MFPAYNGAKRERKRKKIDTHKQTHNLLLFDVKKRSPVHCYKRVNI